VVYSLPRISRFEQHRNKSSERDYAFADLHET
jgi:hypothetical protein